MIYGFDPAVRDATQAELDGLGDPKSTYPGLVRSCLLLLTSRMILDARYSGIFAVAEERSWKRNHYRPQYEQRQAGSSGRSNRKSLMEAARTGSGQKV